MSETKVQIV